MLKRPSHIFLFLALFITLSHNAVAHHHESGNPRMEHHHDGDEGDYHNIFSLSQLDETYLHSDNNFQLENGFVTLFDIQTEFSFDFKQYPVNQIFYLTEIFPPPDDPCCHLLNLRGPPVS